MFSGPLPTTGFAVVAKEGEEIIGFAFLQQVWHAEPFWVAPKHRNGSVFSKLAKGIFDRKPANMQGALAATDNTKLGRVLERLGFVNTKQTTYRWMSGD